jgi:hypothetical protein
MCCAASAAPRHWAIYALDAEMAIWSSSQADVPKMDIHLLSTLGANYGEHIQTQTSHITVQSH